MPSPAHAQTRSDLPQIAEKYLLSAIVDSSDDAIISRSLDGTITTWNLAARRMFGYESSEVIGRSVATLVPADRQDEETRILSRLMHGERIKHYETTRIRKDGGVFEVELTISPIKD